MADKGWSIARASAMGTSHFKTGAPCQDYCTFSLRTILGTELLVIVVCDGAGSASRSDVGSELVATKLVNLAELFFEQGGTLPDLRRETVLMWIEQIRVVLEEAAKETEDDIREFACTLLAAIVGPSAAAFIQVGDGAIVVSGGPDDGWSYVYWPQHGEFANSTNFVVSPDVSDLLRFEVGLRRVSEIAVFSDGIEHLVLHFATKTVHEPFFEKMMRPLRASQAVGIDEQLSQGLYHYLSSSTVCDKTDDDKTLILASRWQS